MASLSYLEITRLTGDVFMGGILTVNELGLPTEFIHSEPLKPSKLQISLYGSALGRYLMLDVVGKGLVEASNARGVPIVCGSPEYLPLAVRVKRPLCTLTPTALRPEGEVGKVLPAQGPAAETEFTVLLSEVQSPWQFRIFDRANFPPEQHMTTFADCARRFDLLEPLTRVKRTLELIRESGSKAESA